MTGTFTNRMTVAQLVEHLVKLGPEAQSLPVFRADVDFGPVPVKEVEVLPMYAYANDVFTPHVDYFEFPDEDHVKFKGVQIR